MKRTCVSFSLFLACLISLLVFRPALAFPPLPSSFFGTVRVNEATVSDGTLVRALINGQPYAQGITQAYRGESVYSLDIPGDDPSTPTLEGGREGDTIQFEIGGVLADQTDVWHSGTNVQLDLTVSTAAQTPVWTPAPTHTPSPTPTSSPTTPPASVPTSKPAPTGSSLPTASRPAPTASPTPGFRPTTATPARTPTVAPTRSPAPTLTAQTAMPSPFPSQAGSLLPTRAPTFAPTATHSSPGPSPVTALPQLTPVPTTGAVARSLPVQPAPTDALVSPKQTLLTNNDKADPIQGWAGITLVIVGAVIGVISIAGIAVCVVMGIASRKRASERTGNHDPWDLPGA